jgi:hypothetical protein
MTTKPIEFVELIWGKGLPPAPTEDGAEVWGHIDGGHYRKFTSKGGEWLESLKPADNHYEQSES